MNLARLVLVIGAVTAVGACTSERGDSGAEATTPSTLAVPEVTAPAERGTPFCQIMLDLDDNVPEDPTVNVTAMVLVSYREALPVAPPEIAVELEAVIIGLETGTEPTLPAVDPESATDGAAPDSAAGEPEPVESGGDATADTFVPETRPAAAPASTFAPPSSEEAFIEEGYTPDDTPAIRLNEYVDFACRGSLNNPGPPATQPSATPAPSDQN